MSKTFVRRVGYAFRGYRWLGLLVLTGLLLALFVFAAT
jgi:hypothetical protein